jgi:uncharacterized membrane protein (TIGR02234 family)
MRGPRAELGLAVALCLLGACLVLVGLANSWLELAFTGSPVLPDTVVVVRGAEFVPGVRALAIVGLAGVVALLATRGVGRVAVGAVLAACGTAVVAVVVRLRSRFPEAVREVEQVSQQGALLFDEPPVPSAWLWVCVAGGVVLLLAGLLVAVRGPRWAALSRRYESPAARQDAPADPTERSLWEALDRGEDPTSR